MSGTANRPVDVIVVGGGPAGSTAARTLARGGARVLVLDRAAFPRNKPCGGGLTYRVTTRFPYLNDALPRISTHAIRRLYMEAPGGESVVVASDRPTVLMVRRVEFDHLLLGLAREAGADVLEGVEITRASQQSAAVRLEARDGRVFEAPLVVAADGVYSVVARRLGLNPGWPRDAVALDMMEETPTRQLRAVDGGTLWVSFAPGRGHGYGYIFPKQGFVNVGVGYVLSSYSSDIAARPLAVHEAFVAGLRERGLVEGECDRSRFTPYQVPVGGPLTETARGRVFLAGDAGGFVNGFSAEGIYFAMVTGDLAAQTILQGASTRLFERMWRREIGAELKNARFLSQFVFADVSRVARLVRGVRQFPGVASLLVDYATGADTFQGVRRRFMLRFPAVFAKLVVNHFKQRWVAWRRREA
ncbi:MAG: NAD(P)/FAD-dependent oxidoreductase [Acidobacteria bacterium]|nr:NAD(P)/FAD-dependent oxidoreductase [Acidobacteriota bacterium]